MTALADLEAALAASWDREQLAVYGDYLQAQGDPRGELIAIDQFVAAHGASAELASRKRSVVEGWLGVELAARVLAAGVIEDGFVDLRVGSLDELREVLASAAGPYLRSLAIGGNYASLPAAVELLAGAPRRWLRRLAVRRFDDYPRRLAIDDATSDALIAATPALDALEVRGYWVFGELAHPHLRRLRVTCLTALGSLLREGPPLSSASELDFAFEVEAEGDLAELDRIFPCCRLPALRCLDLSRNEPGKGQSIRDHEAALVLLPRLPIRTQLTHLRLPSLRSNDQLDELERAIGDMPSVVEVRIARAYSGLPLRSPRSPIVIASHRPWPAADLEDRALHIPGDSKHGMVYLRGAITLMEETFDALPEAARELWTAFWELAGEHERGTNAPFNVPSHLLARALDAIPSDTLRRYEDWAEMREALGRDTCPPALEDHFERERRLSEARFAITFQVYRANLKAKTLEELFGQQLAEFGIDRAWVSEADTVVMVKELIRPVLHGTMEESDRFTFFSSGEPMQDDALFYTADYMALPFWVQVVLHDCELERVEAAIRRLRATGES